MLPDSYMCSLILFLPVHPDVIFFFFNDTSTTEIYTYLHTLSLHYSLPICKAFICSTLRRPGRASCHGCPARRASFRARGEIGRHTSELLSLMSNSYAVFCLKKKREERKTAESS